MSNELINEFYARSETLLAPVVKANQLGVTVLERVVHFQLDALQSYVEIGLAQLKAAAEVTDVEAAKAFYANQVEVAGTVRQKVVDDAKALAEIGADYKAELNSLAKEAAEELAVEEPASEPAPEQAA